jgi:hypothetical protein
MMASASKAFEVFRYLGPWDRPQVIVGFADGAAAAARLLLRDTLPAALVALAPSTKGDSATAGHAVGMDYELTSIVIDWLRRTVLFPQ